MYAKIAACRNGTGRDSSFSDPDSSSACSFSITEARVLSSNVVSCDLLRSFCRRLRIDTSSLIHSGMRFHANSPRTYANAADETVYVSTERAALATARFATAATESMARGGGIVGCDSNL